MKKELNQTAIWLDGSKAVIIELVNDQEAITEITAEIDNAVHHSHQGKSGTFMGAQHVNDEKKFESRKRHQMNQYFDEIIEKVKNVDQILLMGPAEMKTALQTRIQENKQMKDKLVGIETTDYLSLNQMVAEAKRLFKNIPV